jgi:hypothetical protein
LIACQGLAIYLKTTLIEQEAETEGQSYLGQEKQALLNAGSNMK